MKVPFPVFPELEVCCPHCYEYSRIPCPGQKAEAMQKYPDCIYCKKKLEVPTLCNHEENNKCPTE